MCATLPMHTRGTMLTIRITRITDGGNYTTLNGANGSMVFRFDEDTGDDRRVLFVELGPWRGGEIMLDRLSSEEGFLVCQREDVKHNMPLIQRLFPQEEQC